MRGNWHENSSCSDSIAPLGFPLLWNIACIANGKCWQPASLDLFQCFKIELSLCLVPSKRRGHSRKSSKNANRTSHRSGEASPHYVRRKHNMPCYPTVIRETFLVLRQNNWWKTLPHFRHKCVQICNVSAVFKFKSECVLYWLFPQKTSWSSAEERWFSTDNTNVITSDYSLQQKREFLMESDLTTSVIATLSVTGW